MNFKNQLMEERDNEQYRQVRRETKIMELMNHLEKFVLLDLPKDVDWSKEDDGNFCFWFKHNTNRRLSVIVDNHEYHVSTGRSHVFTGGVQIELAKWIAQEELEIKNEAS